ncbi:alpha-galactosidase [Alterisphingorhabdus coralli]|uniref:alpha-galactosidase n=1 Tax=Alterisphingorhabdus coralli TaxID=3071408 RepID=A0AA97F9P4_9SPHN|nr:alpha-galactosidase [Parasphingorhabdus sp. SCSIO 66989]WOE75832.1 alpha-galactosidase [Parasphingorhabdus sp. SCSIO 66989]
MSNRCGQARPLAGHDFIAHGGADNGLVQKGRDMSIVTLSGRNVQLVVNARSGQPPLILHWGAPVAGDAFPEMLRHPVPGREDVVLRPSLAMEPGLGLSAQPGLLISRNRRDWDVLLGVEVVERQPNKIRLICADQHAEVRLIYDFISSEGHNVITASARLENIGQSSLAVHRALTMTLPLPPHISDIIGFSGLWAGEFQTERIKRFAGAWVRENRRGRGGHNDWPSMMLADASTDEHQGDAYGLHLGWSGNSRLSVETLPENRILASAGALFFPGEIVLQAGAHIDLPALHLGWSNMGLNGLSQSYHEHIRQDVMPQRSLQPERPERPVHYNSWEAVYFDHDLDTLAQLADLAAEAGAERFVLDDGWFKGRRSDQAGLGDWQVDTRVYPDGLTPLIDHVHSLGMEFGLWVEPEMVNPDSDLYRAHPDWILQSTAREPIPFRNQHLLDLTRSEVFDHIYDALDRLLCENPIGYLKWDMNRDINHPANALGLAVAHEQIRAVYAMVDRLRQAHPAVAIEGCSSGGGRADLGILQRTERIWASDNNDALERLGIQWGASHMLPLCATGAHVGPRICHITGRILPMELRVAVAMFGNMGIEADLRQESDKDRMALARAIALYKQHRDLLHQGDFYRLERETGHLAVGVVSKARDDALFMRVNLAESAFAIPSPLRLKGLDAEQRYQISLVWPDAWCAPNRHANKLVQQLQAGEIIMTGADLMHSGLQLPVSHPQTALMLHLQAMG